MLEAESIAQAEEVAAKARKFYLDALENAEIQNRFMTEPLAVYAEYGLNVPEEHHELFLSEHRQLVASNGKLACKLCRISLKVVLITVGVGVLTVLAAAVAVFFEVALAAAVAAIELIKDLTISYAVIAGLLCASPAIDGPCDIH